MFEDFIKQAYGHLEKGQFKPTEAKTLALLLEEKATADEIRLLLESIPTGENKAGNGLERFIEQGYNHLKTRKLDEAREAFESALQLVANPEELARLKIEIAKIDLALGHEKQARRELNEALLAAKGIDSELAQAIEELLKII